MKWEHDGERFEACDHTTSIRFLCDPSPGKVAARDVTIERGDPWSIREDQHDVHLMVDAPGPQTIAVMPKGIVSSTVHDWLRRVAPQS